MSLRSDVCLLKIPICAGDASLPPVVVTQMIFRAIGNTDAADNRDLVLDLTGDLEKLKDSPLTVKQGVNYKIEIAFTVNTDMVAGLKYKAKVKRKGIKLDSMDYMLGSYGAGANKALTPSDEMPSGMLARGDYTVSSKFLDDDKNEHLAWEW